MDLLAIVGSREVTVQTLRVDGKKMTLQFFRQLPVAPFFLEEDTPDKELFPWGRVLYKIPKEGEAWLLAGKGEQLSCCCIDKPHSPVSMVDYHSRSMAEATKELANNLGGRIEAFYKGSLERHVASLSKAKASVALAEKQAAVLERLDTLPQLFLA